MPTHTLCRQMGRKGRQVNKLSLHSLRYNLYSLTLMTKKRSKNICYVASDDFWVPAFLGFICLIISVLLKHHLFYSYYYFFAASIISFFLSYRKYAIIGKSSIVLYLRPSLLKKIEVEIPINQIDLIRPKIKIIDGFVSTSEGGIPYKFKIEFIAIRLNKPIDQFLLNILKKETSFGIFKRNFGTDDKASSIILYKAPKGGFKKFLEVLKDTIAVSDMNVIEGDNQIHKISILFVSLVVLTGFITLLFFMTFF